MENNWPELSYAKAKDTYDALLYWTQIVGKIKLAKLPWINHSWHVPLYVSPKGLTTSAIPCGDQFFQIEFNFIDHRLEISTHLGAMRSFELKDICVADFYNNTFKALEELDIGLVIYPVPNEVSEAVPFPQNDASFYYDSEEMSRFHKALLIVQQIFMKFRSEFRGKCSPVHFFWGADDLAVSRFSGRRAPLHPGGIPNLPDRVTQEAYSHEVSSAGFWPGNSSFPQAAFYSYIYPEPEGFRESKVTPEDAGYNKDFGEFILPYDIVRRAEDPEEILLSFLRSTYNAAAEHANWDRENLE